MTTVGVSVTISDDTLRRAASKSGLTGASKNQMVRYFALRLIMDADDAYTTVFGTPEDLTASHGRIHAYLPEHERDMILQQYPGIGFSELIRTGAEIAASKSPMQAVKLAHLRRGPKAGKKNTS